jgi:hypothetical protein
VLGTTVVAAPAVVVDDAAGSVDAVSVSLEQPIMAARPHTKTKTSIKRHLFTMKPSFLNNVLVRDSKDQHEL